MSVHPRHVGILLREARERRGQSLRYIANSTRISIAALEALENGNIKRLPGGIFSRAFVRAYAHEVGLDPEDTVRQFVEDFPVESVTIGSPLVEDATAGQGDSEADFRPWPGLVLIGAAAIIGLLGLTWAVMWWRGTVDAAASAEPPLSAARSAASTVLPEPGPVARPAADAITPATPPVVSIEAGVASPAPASGLHLTLTPDALCWARVVADGRAAFEGLLTRGASESVDASKALSVTVGDAAACRFTVNGRPGRPLGRAGQVLTVRITVDNVREFQQ